MWSASTMQGLVPPCEALRIDTMQQLRQHEPALPRPGCAHRPASSVPRAFREEHLTDEQAGARARSSLHAGPSGRIHPTRAADCSSSTSFQVWGAPGHSLIRARTCMSTVRIPFSQRRTVVSMPATGHLRIDEVFACSSNARCWPVLSLHIWQQWYHCACLRPPIEAVGCGRLS